MCLSSKQHPTYSRRIREKGIMSQYTVGIVAIVVAILSAFGGTSCVTTPFNKECNQACNTCPGATCSDNCITCPATYYGTDCTRNCPTHCKEGRCELLSNGRSVNCTMGCQTGYRGLTCNTGCKRPCLTCDRYSGRCTGPCRDGFYGGECLQRCSYTCNRCDKGTGKCLDPCENGFYGSSCSQRCSHACSRCDKESGECRGHCNDGFHGDTCTKIQLSDAQNGDDLNMNITTEVQDGQTTPHITRDSIPENMTTFPQPLPTTKTHNPYIIAIVVVVVAAGLLVLITTPFLLCTWRRSKPQSRSENDEANVRSDSDHVYDEIGPPPVPPMIVTLPTVEAGYLIPTQPKRDTGSIITADADTGSAYLTATETYTQSRHLTPTRPCTDTGSIVTTPAGTEAGFLTATQPNTETRYLTLSPSNTEARYLTLGQPYTVSIVKTPTEAEAGYLTPSTDTRYLSLTQPNKCPGQLTTFQPNCEARKTNASKPKDCG
ncbi:uncharacterized protein [Haliotis asinina]|uniref:uncharacterized protein n=1 Tax=Haliotis asinina TaxID=109174 RepID=UPI0035327D90